MKENNYVYVVQCEGCLFTESFHDIEGVFATDEGARQCIEDNAFITIADLGQYREFDKGYEENKGRLFWEVRSKEWPDLYISYHYDKVLVQ